MVRTLLSSDLRPAMSQLIRRCEDGSYHLRASVKRALLEVVASGTATTVEKLNTYIRCTLLAAEVESCAGGMEELVRKLYSMLLLSTKKSSFSMHNTPVMHVTCFIICVMYPNKN